MADQSMAPKSRVNITYKNDDGGMEEQIELPNVMFTMGDFGGKHEGSLQDRKVVEVDKRNLDQVMAAQGVELKTSVSDKLSPGAEGEQEIGVHLKFDRMKDFEPEAVAKQVPSLAKLMNLRQALLELKTAFTDGDVPMDKIKAMLKDEEARAKLMSELGLAGE
jgi:type VI secretion system protein ImpB